MRKLVMCLLILVSAFALPAYANDRVVVFAQDIPASELIGMLYREIFKRPFVLSQTVQSSRSLVSMHIDAEAKQASKQATDYVSAWGFMITRTDGVDRVEMAPVAKKEVNPRDLRVPVIYRPRFREPSELAVHIRGLFPDVTVSGVQPGSVGETMSGSGKLPGRTAAADVLAVLAPPADVSKIRSVLTSLDTPGEDLVVKAAVFEVGVSDDTGSAFQLASRLLSASTAAARDFSQTFSGPRMPSSTAVATAAVGTAFNIGAASIDVVISSLASDGRFSLVTSPTVRARSGIPTSLNVGQSVPVLGSVSFNRDTGPIQSVEYRDAGVIFTVRPIVQRNNIVLELHQELSDFVATTTGVNNSPTLTKRALSTSLAVKDGEIVMLGGLSQQKSTEGSRGLALVPPAFRLPEASAARTELLLVLEVRRMRRTADPEERYQASRDPIPGTTPPFVVDPIPVQERRPPAPRARRSPPPPGAGRPEVTK
jgi:general secretion pathway protein D